MAPARTAAAKAKNADQEAADAARTETPSGADDAATSPTPADPEVKPDDAATSPDGGKTGSGKPETTEAESASASLKSRRQAARDGAATDRVPTQVFDTGDKPTELTPEQAEGQNGLPQFHPGGAETLLGSPFSGHTVNSSEYVFPEDDGFISYLPLNSKTPVTVRVWSRGQAVRRDIHEHYQGKAASTPEGSTVLDGKDVLVSR